MPPAAVEIPVFITMSPRVKDVMEIVFVPLVTTGALIVIASVFASPLLVIVIFPLFVVTFAIVNAWIGGLVI